MKMKITDTTDGMYIGSEFDSEDNPISLRSDIQIYVEKTIPLPGGLRFINSNYVIDGQEI